MQGSTVGSATTALLDADSPTDLLQRADLLDYAGQRKLDVIGQLERATVRRANSESTARQLLAAQRAATERAERLRGRGRPRGRRGPDPAGRAAEPEQGFAAQLEAARVELNGLYAERARYAAVEAGAGDRRGREAARQRRLRAEAAARAAAAAAAERASSHARSTGAAGSAGSSRSARRSTPRWSGGGGWSASKGQRVADLALRWLGTPYSWGGGNSSGPTWGQSGPVGFDCSGLALWAWAQVGIYLPHYSGYQYASGRRISSGALRPGDLVFWAYNTGDPGSIHHVAIYLGGGRVVQAPQTGDVVKISGMWYDGYIGAARPGA